MIYIREMLLLRSQHLSHCFTHNTIILQQVKWSRYWPDVAQRVGRGIALLFHDRGTRRGVSGQQHAGRTLPSGKTWYPFYRRLGGPQGRSGRAENLVPTGIRSRTVQPVVSRYTDWATWPTILLYTSVNVERGLSITRWPHIHLHYIMRLILHRFFATVPAGTELRRKPRANCI